MNGSIAAAVRGSFGDVRFTDRTRGSELFVNPLMALCFAFDLPGLAARCLYLDRIEDTHLMRQVHSRIAEFRESVVPRPPRRFPHWCRSRGHVLLITVGPTWIRQRDQGHRSCG